MKDVVNTPNKRTHEQNIKLLNDVKHFYKLSAACKKCSIDRGNLYNLLNGKGQTLKAVDVERLTDFVINDIVESTKKWLS